VLAAVECKIVVIDVDAPKRIEERVKLDLERPAAGTAAGEATMAGRGRREDTRPATGSHIPQAVRLSYTKPTESSAAPPL
ncbi:hypothetical protein ACLOJK_007854, partial [Asimina triloba]